MVSFDCRVFGYRLISVEKERRHKLLICFMRLGIYAKEMGDGAFAVKERDFKAFKRYAGGRIRYVASETKGLFGVIKRNTYRIPTLIALVLAILLNVFLSCMVWDIRVSGAEGADEERVVAALKDAGVFIGRPWWRIETDYAEAKASECLDEISWIKINRVGTVAFVEVIKNEGVDSAQPSYTSSNLVASHDAVIEEITVSAGTAMVKAGDVVKAGDILISGIITGEEGTELVRACGNVVGRATDTLSVVALREEEITEYSDGETVGTAFEIFGFRINIFKKYGNLPDNCDIIENKNDITLCDGRRLPFTTVSMYVRRSEVRTLIYSDSELPTIAGEKLTAALEEALRGRDIIRLSTHGDYTDTGYEMQADIIYSLDIGKEIPIEVEGG